MFANSPSFAELLMSERSKDVLREAEQDRLGRKVPPARPRILDQTLAGVGGLLVSTGRKLQARQSSAQNSLRGSPSPASR
jgi:hypothetical protein